MKACYYCPYGFEDDQGVWCSVNWDTLEYEQQHIQDRIRRACEKAKARKEQEDAK